jgi:hypothetical protein
MDRRYQVFVSSTYMDLVDERREVMQALIEMDCLPAGMEMFPAANDDQWTLIQQVIDESDYYVVIVGGRYGSMAPDGISYTEKEYDYAASTGKPVLGFVHANPGQLPLDKSQPTAQAELDAFVAKVKTRLVRAYSSPAELGSAVSRSLIKTMKKNPAEGWVRGKFAMTPEAQTEMAELRAQVAELRRELEATVKEQAVVPENLASGTDMHVISGVLDYLLPPDPVIKNQKSASAYFSHKVSWNEVLWELGPVLMSEASEEELRHALNELVMSSIEPGHPGLPKDFARGIDFKASTDSLNDVIIQLFALNLTGHGQKKRSTTDRNKYWSLTPLGQDSLMKLRAVPKGDDITR